MRAKTLLALSITAAVVGTGGALAAGQSNDGVNLKGQFTGGGSAQLELEARNVEPLICFVYDNPTPVDGDAIHSSIHSLTTRAEIIDLGTGDQWVNGTGSGCQIPADPTATRAVFTHPQDYYLQLEIVDHQGNPGPRGPFTTQALQPG